MDIEDIFLSYPFYFISSNCFYRFVNSSGMLKWKYEFMSKHQRSIATKMKGDLLNKHDILRLLCPQNNSKTELCHSLSNVIILKNN